MGFWILSLPLGLFSFCCLLKLDVMCFVLSFYVLFCYVWLLALKILLFSNKRQQSSRSSREELAGVEEGEAVIRIYCMRQKKSIFKIGKIESLKKRKKISKTGRDCSVDKSACYSSWGPYFPSIYWAANNHVLLWLQGIWCTFLDSDGAHTQNILTQTHKTSEIIIKTFFLVLSE